LAISGLGNLACGAYFDTLAREDGELEVGLDFDSGR
jgi:hypothetical protein